MNHILKMIKNLIPFLFILFLLACSKDENDALKKCWSLAERGEDFQLYYHCGDERIKPSRFNPTYKFLDSNKCEYLELSSRDAHSFKEGVYEYNPKTSILIVKSKKGDQVAKFRILDFSTKEMKVQTLE